MRLICRANFPSVLVMGTVYEPKREADGRMIWEVPDGPASVLLGSNIWARLMRQGPTFEKAEPEGKQVDTTPTVTPAPRPAVPTSSPSSPSSTLSKKLEDESKPIGGGDFAKSEPISPRPIQDSVPISAQAAPATPTAAAQAQARRPAPRKKD